MFRLDEGDLLKNAYQDCTIADGIPSKELFIPNRILVHGHRQIGAGLRLPCFRTCDDLPVCYLVSVQLCIGIFVGP